MKVIRIATLAAALCVGITSAAAAQGTEPPQQGQGENAPWRRNGRIASQGHQSDGCAEGAGQGHPREVRTATVGSFAKSVQATGSPPDEATAPKMIDLQSKQAAEIRAVLTADQQATFDKNLAEMKSQMESRRKGS